jgi:hypothetical protein
VKATSVDFIETTIPWSAQLDFVGVVAEAPGSADVDGLYVLNVVLAAYSDGTNPPCRWTIVNKVAAL